jgi:hypothetical protein
MDEAYGLLLKGVKRGTASWSDNHEIVVSDIPAEYWEIFQAGIDLAEERHWATLSETDEDFQLGKDQYDSFAYWVNGWFGVNVAEKYGETSNAPVVFVHPETGEKTFF